MALCPHPLDTLPEVERWLVTSHMETGGITFGTIHRLIQDHFRPPPDADTKTQSDLWLLAVRQFFASQLEHREEIQRLINGL